MEKNVSTRIGEIFNDSWEIKRCIGKGSFSEIFLAKDIRLNDGNYVAIKVQNSDFESTVIRWEGEVLKGLVNVPTVPKFIHFGTQDNSNYLVMELLSGEDMASLRNRIRSSTSTGLIALPGAVYLTRQMLKCLRAIHEKGYVHRDVKPANFVRCSKDSTEFNTIDFGITKLHREKNGALRPKREKAEFRGTTLYASVYTHELEDQSPRDDLYSIFYVLLDLICGKLPWTEATRAKEKQQVAALKRKYFDHEEELMNWVSGMVFAAEAEHSITMPDYKGNFPSDAQQQCLTILKHLKTLKYEDIPDYDLIDNCLQKCFTTSQMPDVSSSDYSYMGFKWSGGLDKLKKSDKHDRLSVGTTSAIKETPTIVKPLNMWSASSAPVVNNLISSSSSNGVEYYTGSANTSRSIETMRLHQVCMKVNSMLKEFDARSAANGNKKSPNDVKSYFTESQSPTSVTAIAPTDITIAIRWKNLAKDLMLLPESFITSEVMILFHKALTAHDGFYNIAIPLDENIVKVGKENLAWNNFVEVQQIIGAFYDLYDRIVPKADVLECASSPLEAVTQSDVEVVTGDDIEMEELFAGLRRDESIEDAEDVEVITNDSNDPDKLIDALVSDGAVDDESILAKRNIDVDSDVNSEKKAKLNESEQ